MISRITVAFLSAVLLGLGLAAPATADTTARQTNVGDLYVRAERPSGHQLESQYAAMWNPAPADGRQTGEQLPRKHAAGARKL